MWRPPVVEAPGCGGPWLWRPPVVEAPGCGGPWLWRPLVVEAPGCGGPRLWRPLVVWRPLGNCPAYPVLNPALVEVNEISQWWIREGKGG